MACPDLFRVRLASLLLLVFSLAPCELLCSNPDCMEPDFMRLYTGDMRTTFINKALIDGLKSRNSIAVFYLCEDAVEIELNDRFDANLYSMFKEHDNLGTDLTMIIINRHCMDQRPAMNFIVLKSMTNLSDPLKAGDVIIISGKGDFWVQ